MGLSNQEKSRLVAELMADDLTREIREEATSGNLDPGSLHRRLSTLLNESSTLAGLEPGDQRAVLGMTTGQIKRLIPQKPRELSPGEQVLGLEGEALWNWRRDLVKRTATPVGFVYEQARHSLELEPGHPRRRDLAWDIVNAAITAVRYTCVVGITDYVDGGLTDAQLNRALFEVVRRPADGSWSSLLWSPDTGAEHSLAHVLGEREQRVKALDGLRSRLTKSCVPGKDTFGPIKGLPGKAPGTVKELADAFVSFRNELVHGVYSRKRPEDDVLERPGRVLDVLLATLEPVLSLPLVVSRDGEFSLAAGPTLGSLDDLEVLGGEPLPKEWESLPILLTGTRRLVLSPWVTVADLSSAVVRAVAEQDEGEETEDSEVALSEICFFNRFEGDLVHYLGFAARAQLPHTDLVESDRAQAAFQVFSEHMETLRLQSAPAAARKADPVQRFDALAGFH
ncbi:MAG: hypothetical protein VX938_06455, partial [Myxococcota bacterium]|nr:hypothetical protein [Myxococcota bacterium]